jgi:alpha-1,2-mannosyltransferase
MAFMNIELKNLTSRLVWVIVAIIMWRTIVPLGKLIRDFPLNDFSVYLDGTKAALKGVNPYQLRFFDRFNYSPAATLFFIPLTLIPKDAAELVFTAISILSLLLSVKIIFELLKIKISSPLFWLIFALALKTYPSKLTLALGQINLIILALIVGSYYCCKIRLPLRQLADRNDGGARPFQTISGILLGLATILKLTPAPLLIYFLFRKKWKTVWWFTVTVVLLTLVGIAVFGWDLTYYYYSKTIPQLMNENTVATLNGSYMNQSVTALLGKFGIFGGLNSVIRLGVSGILTVSILIMLKTDCHGIKRLAMTREIILFWNLTVISMLFLPVFVWQHHYTILIPFWIIFTAKFIETKNLKSFAVSGLAYFLLTFYIKDPYLPSKLNPFLSGHFLTTAIIFLILSSYAMGSDQKQISGRKQLLKQNSGG